jgi:hypothetical protein
MYIYIIRRRKRIKYEISVVVSMLYIVYKIINNYYNKKYLLIKMKIFIILNE